MHAPRIMLIASSWLSVLWGKQENSGTDERKTKGSVEKRRLEQDSVLFSANNKNMSNYVHVQLNSTVIDRF